RCSALNFKQLGTNSDCSEPGHQQQRVSGSCQELTRERLRLHLQMRRPAEFAIDQDTLNTPIHRLLESPESRSKPSQTADTLCRLLSDLASVGYLGSYINLANRCGCTPLSICLLTEQYSNLISVLISHGAQLHHLCGSLADRCNHLHFAMSKASPKIIDSTLDEVFRTYPSGADGMYALNRRGETPKAALMRRTEEAT
uniref:ANK_REP_REGION domain-containing protein n=1 Tax=Macrostomum lignano TaxID=282301 RepID=A0A1I8HSY4_9PLAT